MDAESQKRLSEIIAKDNSELTPDDVAFVTARRGYLPKDQWERFSPAFPEGEEYQGSAPQATEYTPADEPQSGEEAPAEDRGSAEESASEPAPEPAPVETAPQVEEAAPAPVTEPAETPEPTTHVEGQDGGLSDDVVEEDVEMEKKIEEEAAKKAETQATEQSVMDKLQAKAE